MTLEETCELAKRELHKFIDLISDREFFYVEFWHIFRTTGMLMANVSPEGYRLYNGDLIRPDNEIVKQSRDSVMAILNNPVGMCNYEIEKAKWQESIKSMQQHEV